MNSDTISNSLDVKAVIDFVTLIIIGAIGVTVMRRFRYLGLGIVILAVSIFLYSQTMVRQSLLVNKAGDFTQLSVRSKRLLPVTPNQRNMEVLGCQFLMFPQLINYVTGDRTFEFSRRAAIGQLVCSFPEVDIRLYSELPKSVILVSQHVPCVYDIWGFLAVSGEGHNLDVIQDLGPEVYKKHLTNIFLKYLYGARPIERSNREVLETQISQLADDMRRYREGEGKHSVCIWPSGKFWKTRCKNGFDKFKPGTFYLSMYSQLPICLVHTRFRDGHKLICTRTQPILPPAIPPELNSANLDYKTFVERPEVKLVVEEYRLKVEQTFRKLDDALCRELGI